MSRRLMITVDVEAQKARTDTDHVDRLIWGRFPEGRAGLDDMMTIADRHGVKLTMFLDYCEGLHYGAAISDVAREIDRRGHDLELHAHLDFLPPEWWAKRDLQPQTDLNRLSAAQAIAVVDLLCESHFNAIARTARAFRGGGYRFNNHVLNALVGRGVRLDSSINVSRVTQPVTRPSTKQFEWWNGCLEVPVSCVTRYRNLTQPLDFNFNAGALSKPQLMIDYLDQFYAEHGDDAIAVLVMHSWSFLTKGEKHFSAPRPDAMARFGEFLDLAKRQIQFVTAEQVTALHKCGELALDEAAEWPSVTELNKKSNALSTVETPTAPTVVGATDRACAVCGASVDTFRDVGGIKRVCPACGSLERQRAFAALCQRAPTIAAAIKGKRVLLISPVRSEILMMKKLSALVIDSIDIRPEVGASIVGDICDMPMVAAGTYDTVFASYVLSCVHEDKAALKEIARILRPDGVLLASDPVSAGKSTVDYTDEAVITRFYGEQDFKSYRVGRFRTYGGKDTVERFSTSFDRVVLHDTVDGALGVAVTWAEMRVPRAKPTAKLASQADKPSGWPDPTPTDNPFKSPDAAYVAFKQKNPGVSFARYSVDRHIAHLQKGGEHPTLGANLTKSQDWSTAGLREYRMLMETLDVQPQHKVIDYGCGSLRVGQHFVRHLAPEGFFGLDVTTGFAEIGANLIADLVHEKKSRFGSMEDADTIAAASAFGADIVYSNACVFQIHPMDLPDFVANIRALCAKPGCRLAFDVKISEQPVRYRNSCWAWPLACFVEALAPLQMQLIQRHVISQHDEAGTKFEGQYLIFAKSRA